jgi:hypothetical protein
VSVAVPSGTAASVVAAVTGGGSVSVGSVGGLVGAGDEQDAARRKIKSRKRTRDERCCSMKGILTDIRFTACAVIS